MDPLIASVVKTLIEKAPESAQDLALTVWFRVTAVVAQDASAWKADEVLQIPYSSIGLVAERPDLPGQYVTFLAFQVKDGVMVSTLYRDGRAGGTITLSTDAEGDFVHRGYVSHTPGKHDPPDGFAVMCLQALHGLSAAAARGVDSHQIFLHPKAAARIAQGRVPTYEWRTVTIEPRVRPKAAHKGGTHASPRQHDRRGHWSHSKLGKRYWVRPCKVGKASNGTVFHDYVVKGEPTHA